MTTTPLARATTDLPPDRVRQPVKNTSLRTILLALLVTLLISGIVGPLLLNALLGT